jgi:hypothetical protein
VNTQCRVWTCEAMDALSRSRPPAGCRSPRAAACRCPGRGRRNPECAFCAFSRSLLRIRPGVASPHYPARFRAKSPPVGRFCLAESRGPFGWQRLPGRARRSGQRSGCSGALSGPLLAVAKSTGEMCRVRPRRPASPSGRPFLKTHLTDLVAINFFSVPTVGFRVRFVLVLLAHDRRKITPFNVTEQLTAQWTAQQLVEAFFWETAPKSLLRDRDAIYGEWFQRRITRLGDPPGAGRASASVAACGCGARDWEPPAGVPGPNDGLQLRPPPTPPDQFLPLRPSLAHTSVAGEELP